MEFDIDRFATVFSIKIAVVEKPKDICQTDVLRAVKKLGNHVRSGTEFNSYFIQYKICLQQFINYFVTY